MYWKAKCLLLGQAIVGTGKRLLIIAWDLEEAPAVWLSQTGLLPGVRKLQVLAPGKPLPTLAPPPTATPPPVESGLYVADTSTFPTGIGVNPMITVMAMARRVARTVLAEGSAS